MGYDLDNMPETVELARVLKGLSRETLPTDFFIHNPARIPGDGKKHDQDKVPLQLLPLDALTEIAKVLQFGAKKYAARNWEKGIEYDRVFGATLRHLYAWH